jgi:hypothetical protein
MASSQAAKERQRARRRDAGAGGRAEVAAEAEAQHEGGDDHRDGVEADSRLKGEEPLPRHLIRERRRATQEERETDDDQTGLARDAGHEPPILTCQTASHERDFRRDPSLHLTEESLFIIVDSITLTN